MNTVTFTRMSDGIAEDYAKALSQRIEQQLLISLKTTGVDMMSRMDTDRRREHPSEPTTLAELFA